MTDLMTKQIAFLTFLSKSKIRVKHYEFMGDGSLIIIYKKRTLLYEPAFFESMPRWDAKVKKLVLDSVRYGSAEKAEKARKQRRKKAAE